MIDAESIYNCVVRLTDEARRYPQYPYIKDVCVALSASADVVLPLILSDDRLIVRRTINADAVEVKTTTDDAVEVITTNENTDEAGLG